MPKEKLWVYDTLTYLNVYAESQDEADNKVFQIGNQIGVEFDLVDDWEEYQLEHEEREKKSQRMQAQQSSL
tara:strand:- start:148 stop:360 length:213 start_codon:yes stop_codon:yes gene_type:complete